MLASEPNPVVRLLDAEGELHEHTLEPGSDCPVCHRRVAVAKKDDPTGRARDRVSFTVPVGEEGVLEELMIAVVEKYAEAWPEDARAAREGVGLVLVGEHSWKYRVTHFALYAALTLDVAPAESGA